MKKQCKPDITRGEYDDRGSFGTQSVCHHESGLCDIVQNTCISSLIVPSKRLLPRLYYDVHLFVSITTEHYATKLAIIVVTIREYTYVPRACINLCEKFSVLLITGVM